VEVNPAMELSPEVINTDPYGAGWLAVIKTADWQAERRHLLDAQTYFDWMKGQVEEEAKKP
jgi:glycine cleavage system H protein